jgi:glycine/D-amino acid oxidase-like deaminating enzyme
MPGLTGSWTGALYTASDGKAEPQRAAPAIAEAARRHGAAILTQCAVRGIETQAGRVSAAVTEKGRIACDTVVLAGGAWCRLFCGNLGIELPQLKVLATVMRTEPLEGGPEISASGGLFGFRKRMDGGYAVATLGGSHDRRRPRSFPLFFDYLPAVRLHWKKAADGSAPLNRGGGGPLVWTRLRLSRRCGCRSRPTGSSSERRAPPPPRPSRYSATRSSPKAGAA